MRRLKWKAFVQIVRPNYEVSESARILHRRWLHRQTFVLGVSSSILTLVLYPGYFWLTNQPGDQAFQGGRHHIAVMVVASLCILIPLLFRQVRGRMELFTCMNLLVLLISIAIDSSLSERPRRYTSLGLIPLFGSTLIFTNLRVMTATYILSAAAFVSLNELRSRPGDVIAVYTIAHLAAWWMALVRIRNLQRISLDHARLYDRRLYDQRVKLARNLHDSLGGDFMQLVLQLTGTTPRKKILDLAHIISAKMKNLVYTLDPLTENVRFRDYARSYVGRMRQTGRIKVSLHVDPDLPELRLDHALNLQAIFSEWITNTIRHSRAKELKILLRHRAGRYYLLILDDGLGFRWTGQKQGSGLRNIAVRANLLNAKVFARQKSRKHGTIFFLRALVNP
ncbi:MAG: hypothetical protein U1F27_12760 [Turneriella sp.]